MLIFVSEKNRPLLLAQGVVDWLQINRLSLNFDKIHFIVFHRKRAKISLSAELTINNIKIDQNLSFQSHIMYIKGKVARGIGILYKSRPYFSLETMRMLYNAFVYPYILLIASKFGGILTNLIGTTS